MNRFDWIFIAGGTLISIGVGLFDVRIGIIVGGVIIAAFGIIGAIGDNRPES